MGDDVKRVIAATEAAPAQPAHPKEPDQPRSVRAVVCDINGIFRAKRVPSRLAKKALDGKLKMPLSILFVDIWGNDVIASGHVLDSGDRDGVLRPTERGPLDLEWLDRPSSLLMCAMYTDRGVPFAADPRHALAAIVARYRERGLTPVCATELEFYLHDLDTDEISPPLRPGGSKLSANSVYSLQDLDGFESFLSDVYAACRRLGIQAEEAISENGCGQFEINLCHTDDVLRAADDAQLFKYLVKGVAARHGLGATFMAKPYGGEAGSGMHVHFSLLDGDGHNVFADGTPQGSPVLRAAVAGLLDALPASMLVFAPHYNSYRRLAPDSHAPTRATWGYENRTVAIRIPDGPDAARRIEHRVAGADSNPYLVLAAMLGAALDGIDAGASPPAPEAGNAYEGDATRLPASWEQALQAFEASAAMRGILGPLLAEVFAAAKRQEIDVFARELSSFEVTTYLDVV